MFPEMNLQNISVDPILSMNVWCNTDFDSRDGASVQTSFGKRTVWLNSINNSFHKDHGNSWQQLGRFGDSKWYNDEAIEGLNWSNSSQGWSGAGDLSYWIT